METLDRTDIKKALSDNQVKVLDRAKIREIRAEMARKLSVISLTYGVDIRINKIRFDDVSFKATISGTLINTKSGKSAEEVHFGRHCWRWGLDSSDYNREVTFPPQSKFRGKKGRIVGINPRAKTYPVLIQMSDGTMTKNAVSFVKIMLTGK
jgi:hypothetical protein